MRIVPELAGGWDVGAGGGSVGVVVIVSGVLVSVDVVPVVLQVGPSITPIATSGPLTPKGTTPLIRSPENTALNSPMRKPAPVCH